MASSGRLNAPTASSSSSKTSLGPLEKLPSNTLKRNPKMELGRTDLLKLLSYLEGELQAREIVIATLKAERVKQLLYQAKYGQFSLNDPFSALQRDSYAAYNPSCDEASIKAMYNNQLSQVENLIIQHQKAQQRLRQHLRDAEQQHAKVVSDLEDEIHKHAQDTAQGDDVTYFLEKERDRLHQEVEMEREHNQKLEKELKKVVQAMEQDKLRHKQIVLLLLEDRKRIMGKLVDEHGRNEEMSRYLTVEKDRMAEVEEGLEEESKKSLVMEAELERQAANFSIEKEQLRRILEAEVEKNRQLREQVASLTQELTQLRRRKPQTSPAGEVEGEFDLRLVDGELNACNTTNTMSSTVAAVPPPPPTPPKSTTLQTKIASCTGETILKITPGRISKPVSPVPPITSPTSTATTHSSTMVINTGGGGGGVVNPGPVSPTAATHSSTIIRTLPPITPSPTSPNQQKSGVGDVEGEKSVVRSVVTTITNQPSQQQQPQQQQVVQVTPRVNVSASSGTRVYTTTQGGRLTFHVTAPPQPPKKPPQLSVTAASSAVALGGGAGRGVPPPVPPNKPILPKKEAPMFVQHALVGGGGSISTSSSSSSSASSATPVKIAATPTVGGGLKFGITISKPGNAVLTNNSGSSTSAAATTCVVMSSSSSNATAGGATVITATSAVNETPQQSPQMYKETQPVLVAAVSSSDNLRYTNRNGFSDLVRWSDSPTSPPVMDEEDVEEGLAPALADFQQLLVSMAASSSSRSLSGASFNVSESGGAKMNGGDLCISKRAASSSSTSSTVVEHNWQAESSSSTTTTASTATTEVDSVGETNNSQVLKCVNYTRNGETTTTTSMMREDVSSNVNKLNSIVINSSSSNTGFNPRVRKVVSPTLPKSFNDLKL